MRLHRLLYDPEDFGITKYEWRPDGKLDVFQEVELFSRGLNSLPFSFGKVEGHFLAINNNLDESSIPDLPESCCHLMLSRNKFKNLDGFSTKTDKLFLSRNPLESIKEIKDLKLESLNLSYCDRIKDWNNLPFVEGILELIGSSIESLDCLKNKKLNDLHIEDTNVSSIAGLEVYNLFIKNTEIETLTDVSKCPSFILCDKEKEGQFINELKKMFTTSFSLKK